jgi:ribosomal protein L7/L12
MKVDIDARFEGSVEQFITWVNDTFKNPSGMWVRAVVGSAPRGSMVGPREYEIDVPASVSKPARNLAQTYCITEHDASKIVAELYDLLKKKDRLGAIKTLRERMTRVGYTGRISLGLKEAKDFVDALTAEQPVTDDEIPF